MKHIGIHYQSKRYTFIKLNLFKRHMPQVIKERAFKINFDPGAKNY